MKDIIGRVYFRNGVFGLCGIVVFIIIVLCCFIVDIGFLPFKDISQTLYYALVIILSGMIGWSLGKNLMKCVVLYEIQLEALDYLPDLIGDEWKLNEESQDETILCS